IVLRRGVSLSAAAAIAQHANALAGIIDEREVAHALLRNAAYFSCNRAPALIVGRSPWTAADALVGLSPLSKALVRTKERVQGDPRKPGGLPHEFWHYTLVRAASPLLGTPAFAAAGIRPATTPGDASDRCSCADGLLRIPAIQKHGPAGGCADYGDRPAGALSRRAHGGRPDRLRQQRATSDT